MKKLKNIMLGILIVTTIIIVVGCSLYNYSLTPPKNSKEVVEIEIPNGYRAKQIAKLLKEKKLIRNEKIFLVYVKLMDKTNLKAGTYRISYNTGVKKIADILEKGTTYNPEEVTITFKEGKTMRDIARTIEANTNNSYDSVIEKSNDIDYINTLIEKYWFITDDVKNNELYYKLEGYLFPDTYAFKNKDVTVEEIFNKMIAEMAKKLEPYKQDINKSKLSVHEILTLASMVEKESYDDMEQKKNVASVFMNRLSAGMSLGSDVTALYANKIDGSRAMYNQELYLKSPYNTRLTDGSMNGKLPIGPIATISIKSLEAAINPNETSYLFFIANIKTKETFFYQYSSDFEAKKVELKEVNRGM